jgi:DNA-binding IclR family transcriptional regulator
MSASASASTPAASDRSPASERPAASDRSSYRTSRSLIRGLALLREFTPAQPDRGIAELAREMGVSRPTAHRYAATCLELGYLEQVRGRLYRLTRRSASPGMAVLGTLELSSAGEGILRELREATGRTVALAVLDGADVLFCKRHRGFHRGEYQLERGLGAGSRRAARSTAAGRALLAGTPELTVDDGDLPGRARGLAIAVVAPGRRTSAIELRVPAETMSAAELLAELAEPLRAAGAALEAVLGDFAEERVAR